MKINQQGTSPSPATQTPEISITRKRIKRNKVFAGITAIGKSSKGWFFGFKLHLLINHKGGLLGVKFTPGNVDDRVPVSNMAKNIFGQLFGDKGYISKGLTAKLRDIGVMLFTTIKSNMKPQIMSAFERLLLKKRPVLESVNNIIKKFLKWSIHDTEIRLMPSVICYQH